MNVTVPGSGSGYSGSLPHSHDYHLSFLKEWTELLQRFSTHNGHGSPCFPLQTGYVTPDAGETVKGK